MSTVIQVENLSKRYRLGVIGGGTLALPVLRWAFAGALIAIAVDLSDLFIRDFVDAGGIPNYQAFDKWLDQAYLVTFLVVALRWDGIPRTVAIALFGLMSGQENDQWFYDRNLERWELIANLVDWMDVDTNRIFRGGRLVGPVRLRRAEAGVEITDGQADGVPPVVQPIATGAAVRRGGLAGHQRRQDDGEQHRSMICQAISHNRLPCAAGTGCAGLRPDSPSRR